MAVKPAFWRAPLVVAVFLINFLLLAALANGQSTNALLNGTVTDPAGAAIAGAHLTLVNTATQFESTFDSGEEGEYSFRNLTPGNYVLRVTKAGFEAYVQSGIVLTINQAARADVQLKVGRVEDTVTIEGDASLLNFENGTVSGGVEPRTLEALPLAVADGHQRSAAQLAVLLPGVTTGSSGAAFNSRINGGVQAGDEAILDGATMSEGFMNQSGMVAIQGDFQFSSDMVSEMKVLTSSYEPQYGNTTSGQIIVVSKSGGETFHGGVYEYLRNSGLNAKQWGASKRSFDQENDYGGYIGGPVKLPGFHSSRNRAYFYFNWEHYKENGGAVAPTISIPSLKERSGDFTDWPQKIFDPRTGQQFSCNGVLNVICPNLEDPIATAWMAALPTPTNTSAQSNYLVPNAVPSTLLTGTNVYFWRVDDQVGNKDHFYYTYYRQYAIANLASTLPASISNARPANPQNAPIQRFNWEHTFSPLMVSHLSIGYLNRNEGYYSLNSGSNVPKVPGVGNNAPNVFLPTFTFAGFEQLGEPTGPLGSNLTVRPTWAVSELLSRIMGRHTLVAGIEWRSAQGNLHRRSNQGGTFNFDGFLTANNGVGGSPVADFFIGASHSTNVAYLNVANYYPRQTAWAAHLGDTWRITPKLTLNYGIRWDVETPSKEKSNHLAWFDPTLANPDAVGPNGPLLGALAFATSSKAYPENLSLGGFAPRLGVAYSWDQKTVLRAGYGVYFSQAFYPGWNGGMNLDGYNKTDSAPNTCLSPGNVFCVAGNSWGFQPNGGGYPTPAVTQSLTPGFDNGQSPQYRPVNANERPRSQQWNLTLERELPGNVFVSAAYVGSRGSRLLSQLEPANVLNPGDPRIAPIVNAPCPVGSPNCNHLNDNLATFNANFPNLAITPPYTTFLGSPCANVAQALLPFPQFCSNLQGLNENLGSSNYNSFQLRAEKRFDHGVYMLLSYTNSKLIEDASANTQTAATWSGGQGVVSPFAKKRARAISADDVPQVVSAAFVYDLPFGRGKKFSNDNAAANAIIGGWQISPIIRYSRGEPMFFRSSSCNIPNPGYGNQFRQACIPGILPGVDPFLQDPNHFDPSRGPLFNINAFEPATVFSAPNYFGSGQPITNLRGPNFKDVSLSITKNTAISERVHTKFSLNFFNALNAHYFINDAGNCCNIAGGGQSGFHNDVANGNFGTWNGAVSSPRTIQGALRIEF